MHNSVICICSKSAFHE